MLWLQYGMTINPVITFVYNFDIPFHFTIGCKAVANIIRRDMSIVLFFSISNIFYSQYLVWTLSQIIIAFRLIVNLIKIISLNATQSYIF